MFLAGYRGFDPLPYLWISIFPFLLEVKSTVVGGRGSRSAFLLVCVFSFGDFLENFLWVSSGNITFV